MENNFLIGPKQTLNSVGTLLDRAKSVMTYSSCLGS